MKTIAFYLPQFHEIPENNEWWGQGFTEWVNVKKAKPLFEGHVQPRVPLANNYYDLSDESVMARQIEIAKEYGLYGFCFYHYWFDGKLLLEKPLEAFLANKELSFPFCLCWANEHWTNTWIDGQSKVLVEQKYGKEPQWESHYKYLKKFFLDKDYITVDGKPFVVIYRPEVIPCLNEMLDYWQVLAKRDGFPGLSFAFQHVSFKMANNYDDSRFDFNIEYQPVTAESYMAQRRFPKLRQLKRNITNFVETKFGLDIRSVGTGGLKVVDYGEVWEYILSMQPDSEKAIPGAFVDWDNTPRKKERGTAYIGASPEKFQKYMTEQIRRARDVYHKDMVFIFAWNEWAEGGYMEPDELNGYGYLEALRNALNDSKENTTELTKR